MVLMFAPEVGMQGFRRRNISPIMQHLAHGAASPAAHPLAGSTGVVAPLRSAFVLFRHASALRGRGALKRGCEVGGPRVPSPPGPLLSVGAGVLAGVAGASAVSAAAGVAAFCAAGGQGAGALSVVLSVSLFTPGSQIRSPSRRAFVAVPTKRGLGCVLLAHPPRPPPPRRWDRRGCASRI